MYRHVPLATSKEITGKLDTCTSADQKIRCSQQSKSSLAVLQSTYIIAPGFAPVWLLARPPLVVCSHVVLDCLFLEVLATSSEWVVSLSTDTVRTKKAATHTTSAPIAASAQFCIECHTHQPWTDRYP